MRKLPFLFCAILFLQACLVSKKQMAPQLSEAINPFQYTIQKSLTGQKGAVVSAHPLASLAGLEMLKRGGNAIDAAIATQWALAVVYPGAGNIGGGGFMVAWLNNKKLALDYRETAPAAAHKDMYLDKNGNAIPELSLNGHLAVGIPGTVAGLFASHTYARLPMSVLMAPAIQFAEKGFVLTESEARGLNAARQAFIRYSSHPGAFVKTGSWKTGDTLVQNDLAKTLRRISKQGQKGFYEGETAQLIINEMAHGKGIITKADLKNYKAQFREPLSFDYRGYDIVGMPMPSSGGLLMNQMLKMIEPYNIGSMGFLSPQAVQLMTEVERRAFADRAKFMGDADFVTVPVKALTHPDYLKTRMADYVAGKAGNSSQTREGHVPGYESEQTTHLSVLDKDGNAVAVTTTLNNHFGSKTVVAGAGFILNDEMDDFSAKPGSPNLFGAVGGKANAIAPGKRMLSSMAPTLVLKNNQPYLVVGTPGGTTIPTSVFQSLVNIIDFKMSADDAVNKPKFHHQWLPDRLDVETGFPAATAQALKAMGYLLHNRGQIGRTELIKVNPDGKFEAVADNRGDDSVAGY